MFQSSRQNLDKSSVLSGRGPYCRNQSPEAIRSSPLCLSMRQRSNPVWVAWSECIRGRLVAMRSGFLEQKWFEERRGSAGLMDFAVVIFHVLFPGESFHILRVPCMSSEEPSMLQPLVEQRGPSGVTTIRMNPKLRVGSSASILLLPHRLSTARLTHDLSLHDCSHCARLE